MYAILLFIKKHSIALSMYLLYLVCWISQAPTSQLFRKASGDLAHEAQVAGDENSIYYWLFVQAIGLGAVMTTALLAVVHQEDRVFYAILALCFIIPIIISIITAI